LYNSDNTLWGSVYSKNVLPLFYYVFVLDFVHSERVESSVKYGAG
jgi:hypothetical protein